MLSIEEECFDKKWENLERWEILIGENHTKGERRGIKCVFLVKCIVNVLDKGKFQKIS